MSRPSGVRFRWRSLTNEAWCNVSGLATRPIANKPHPEEAALFCAAVSKDGYAHKLVPSFETHRCAMLLRMRLMVGFVAATCLVGPRRSLASMLHFAYGSNMSVPMMRRRCPAGRLEGRALLPGYRVIITREGYASILFA